MLGQLRQILNSSGSTESSCNLIINAEGYAQHILLQDKPIPWFEATAYANHLKQTVALLKPQVAVISLDKMLEQELINNQQLTTEMSAKSRTGYALKIFMRNEKIKAAVSALMTSCISTQSIPVMIQLPSPLQLLYITAGAALPDSNHEFNEDDAENAAIYIADWLRVFKDIDIAGLIFDECEGDVPKGVYKPITNTAEHYQWIIGIRRDKEVSFDELEIIIPVLPSTFWILGEHSPKVRGTIFTEIARNSVPEKVLDYRETLS